MSKRIIALLLALLMVFALAACQSEDESKKGDKDKNDSVSGEDYYTEEPTLSEEENTVFYLTINYCPTQEEDYYITVSNARGKTTAELKSDVHKIADIDPDLLFDIEEEMIKAGIMDMVGTDTYDDGDGIATVYMEYTDGKPMMLSYSGTIPEEFVTAYKAMEEYFAKLLKDAPEYIPVPVVEGELDEAQQKELLDILNKSGMEQLDGFKLTPVAKDDNLAENLNLDSAEFVVSASACNSTIFEVPYQMAIMKVSAPENIEALRADLADGLPWNRWAHINVNKALIAQKGDLVLCLISFGDHYAKTASAIQSCGWETVMEYTK